MPKLRFPGALRLLGGGGWGGVAGREGVALHSFIQDAKSQGNFVEGTRVRKTQV